MNGSKFLHQNFKVKIIDVIVDPKVIKDDYSFAKNRDFKTLDDALFFIDKYIKSYNEKRKISFINKVKFFLGLTLCVEIYSLYDSFCDSIENNKKRLEEKTVKKVFLKIEFKEKMKDMFLSSFLKSRENLVLN